MKSRKIAFVSALGSAPWGGSEELWSQAALHLLREGHRISACVSHWSPLADQIVALKAEGIRLGFKPSARTSLVAQGLYKVLHLERLWLRLNSPDFLVISQGGISDGLDWLMACQALKIPYCAIVQANAEYWWPDDGKAEQMASAYSAAAGVFFVADQNRLLLERQIGMELPNARLIQNPICLAGSAALPWPPEDLGWNLAVVGRLEPAYKGQDILIDCLRDKQWSSLPMTVNLYGSGPMKKNVADMIRSAGLSNIHLRGFSSDVREIWRHNHALLLPSRMEGTPLALLEAMWAGRPAIVTNVGGNADWCLDGKTGFVCQGTDHKNYNETMLRAWSRRGEWRQMGEAAHAHVLQHGDKDPALSLGRKIIELIG
jgi:glycosyltransferase involved in cell wall biosynthesis